MRHPWLSYKEARMALRHKFEKRIEADESRPSHLVDLQESTRRWS